MGLIQLEFVAWKEHSTLETRTTTKGGKLHHHLSGQTYPGLKYRIQLNSSNFDWETSSAWSDVLNYERKSDPISHLTSTRPARMTSGTELLLDLEGQWSPQIFFIINFYYIYNLLFLAICFNKIALCPLKNIIDIFKSYNIIPTTKIKPKQQPKTNI